MCCRNPEDIAEKLDLECPHNLQEAKGVNECTSKGGVCETVQDGFYVVSYVMLVVGVVLMYAFRQTLPKLSALPIDSWRDKSRRSL